MFYFSFWVVVGISNEENGSDDPFPRQTLDGGWDIVGSNTLPISFREHTHLRGQHEVRDFSPLAQAVGCSDSDIVRVLLAHGANLRVAYHSFTVYQANLPCGGAIYRATESGQSAIVSLIVDVFADIDLQHAYCLVQV